jgi:F-type H+-transporting ATPase subunit epsilon
MQGALTLEVVTPERLVLKTDCDEVIVPAYDGARGILADHEPFVTTLRLGALSWRREGRLHPLVVGEGLLEVRENLVNVLVESARMPEEIDLAAMESARKAALERLQRGGDQVDYLKTQAEVEAAEVHLEVGAKRA